MRVRLSVTLSFPLLIVLPAFLIWVPFSVANAQTRSTPINLEGTEWVGAPVSQAVGSAMGTMQCGVKFEGQGRATYQCLAILSPGTMAGTNLNDPMYLPGVDDPYKPKLVMTPGSSGMGESLGRYVQKGNSVRVEFSDGVMNITVQGNTLLGETVYKDNTKAKERWVMQRARNTSAPVASPSAPQPNTATLGRANSADVLPESMTARYNPAPLRSTTISFQNSGASSYEPQFYSMIAGPGEVTFSVVITAGAQSYGSSVSVAVYDGDERLMAEQVVTTAMGRTKRMVGTFRADGRRAFLLRVRPSSYGEFGRCDIEFSGAIDVRRDSSPGSRSGSTSNALQVGGLAESQARMRESTAPSVSTPNTSQFGGLTESQARMRESTRDAGTNYAAQRAAAVKELSRLGTYRARTTISYKGKEISGNLIIRVKEVSVTGQVSVDISGENGLYLSGVLTGPRVDPETVLKGPATIHFGSLGRQRVDFTMGFFVKDGFLMEGRIFLGSNRDFDAPNGRFVRAIATGIK